MKNLLHALKTCAFVKCAVVVVCLGVGSLQAANFAQLEEKVNNLSGQMTAIEGLLKDINNKMDAHSVSAPITAAPATEPTAEEHRSLGVAEQVTPAVVTSEPTATKVTKPVRASRSGARGRKTALRSIAKERAAGGTVTTESSTTEVAATDTDAVSTEVAPEATSAAPAARGRTAGRSTAKAARGTRAPKEGPKNAAPTRKARTAQKAVTRAAKGSEATAARKGKGQQAASTRKGAVANRRPARVANAPRGAAVSEVVAEETAN